MLSRLHRLSFQNSETSFIYNYKKRRNSVSETHPRTKMAETVVQPSRSRDLDKLLLRPGNIIGNNFDPGQEVNPLFFFSLWHFVKHLVCSFFCYYNYGYLSSFLNLLSGFFCWLVVVERRPCRICKSVSCRGWWIGMWVVKGLSFIWFQKSRGYRHGHDRGHQSQSTIPL